jgi:hypothetical protein
MRKKWVEKKKKKIKSKVSLIVNLAEFPSVKKKPSKMKMAEVEARLEEMENIKDFE